MKKSTRRRTASSPPPRKAVTSRPQESVSPPLAPKPAVHDDARDAHLDAPLWNVEAIGREAGLVDDNGVVNMRATFYALERGNLPATKVGRQWVTTRRRLRALFAGEVSS